VWVKWPMRTLPGWWAGVLVLGIKPVAQVYQHWLDTELTFIDSLNKWMNCWGAYQKRNCYLFIKMNKVEAAEGFSPVPSARLL
jgi:hypothetical protein